MDFLENLKQRYKHATPDGRRLLREHLVALAHAAGCGDEIENWMDEIDSGRVQDMTNIISQKEKEIEGKNEKVMDERSEPEETEVSAPEEKTETPEKEIKLQEIQEGLDSVVKRIDVLTEKLNQQEDALMQHKRILDKLIQEPGELEMKKDEIREKDIITPGEFGIRFSKKHGNGDGDDNDDGYKLYKKFSRKAYKTEDIKNKEENNMAKTPTERRKERRKKAISEELGNKEEPRSLSEFYDIPKDIEKMKKLPSIPETPYVTEEQLKTRKEREKQELKERVWDLSRLAAEYNEEQKKWVLSYEGKPLAEVAYDRNLNVAEDDFASRSFGKNLLKTLAVRGLDEFKEQFDAKILDTNAIGGFYAEEKEEKEEKEKKEEKVEKEAYHMRFVRAMKLARTVMDKGLAENPLKGVLFQTLNRKANIPNPTPYIEEAFRVAGDKYFDTLLGLTQKYLAMDDKTFVEVEEFVKNAKTQIPVSIAEDERNTIIREIEAEELKRRASAGSIPIMTSSFEKVDPLKQAVPKPVNWYTINKT